MPRPRNLEPTIRKTLVFPEKLWLAVAEYRHTERISSEVEAVRRLIELGFRFDNRATSPNGLTFVAVQTAEAIEAERERCAAILQKAADTWWVDFSPDAGDLRAMVQEIRNG